ncbi:MAG TPA: alpha/beta hydrolase [Ideonella sp.]|jgi:pimeloyl-ACP methyl ester carboxylesterase|nr:alpha/beta hydrolase [Ideonella sp.]
MRPSFLVTLCIAGALAAMPSRAEETAAAGGRFHEVRGARLYVESQGSGAPIVFLHGGVRYFESNFALQRHYFASFRKVIGIDQRGHGHSPDDERPFSYREMAEDTAAVIEQLGVGPVDVIGHSDGGNVGLLLARHHPQLVRRLVVSGANLRASLAPDELERRKTWSPQQVAERVHKLSDSLPPQFRPEYEKVNPAGPAHWWPFLTKSYQLWLTPVVIETAELKEIRIPVLVMAGDHDFAPIEETLEIYRSLPQGQLFILPGTGHGTMSSRPELANLAMREFLERP